MRVTAILVEMSPQKNGVFQSFPMSETAFLVIGLVVLNHSMTHFGIISERKIL